MRKTFLVDENELVLYSRIMKIKKKHHKYYLLSFAVIAILTYSLLFTNVLNLKRGHQKYIEIAAIPTQQQKVYEEREYVSELGFKITFSSKYVINQTPSSVVLTSNDRSIILSTSGTNFENINDYLVDLRIKNNLNILEEGRFSEQTLGIIKTKILNNDLEERVTYFIMPDKWTVYTFSTSSPELYGDLEKIVQSFEYLEK